MKRTANLARQFLLLSFLVMVGVSNVSNVQAAEKVDLQEKLVSGKWMNKKGGYIPSPVGTDPGYTVERYKTYTFFKDKTFQMDSLKQRFTGRWVIQGNQVILTFNPKTLVTYKKNQTQNSSGYKTTEVPTDLGVRTARINGDVLDFGSDDQNADYTSNAMSGAKSFWEFTGFANVTTGNLVMILVALIFIFLGIKFEYEPLLLLPIGMGIIIGNIPFYMAEGFNLQLGVYEPGAVFNTLYQGVVNGWYPPLIFLGIGAMTDFSSLISNPKVMLLGGAAQLGIFATFLGALWLGFAPPEAAAIGIIGGADGPTAIFLSSKLANGMNVLANGETVKNLIGPIAIAAYSYMALVPVIQPPIINLLTTKKERCIKMRPPRQVSRLEKQIFPIIGLLLTAFIAPSALPLLGMFFLGNLLKESTVTNRLATTASNALIDTITILLGMTVGASTQADIFLTSDSILIFVLGAFSFMVATAGGIMVAKIMNWCSPKDNPINPMLGAAGVSAVPDSARVVHNVGLKNDPTNYLLMHAMGPNVSGVIGSAVVAGALLCFLM
ncbi:hypothetical protein FACS1894199_12380 [Bacteroidia bacterium]|nr:hypothetical protein FACS1894199_12380 [Bacteroidia bacterium]